MSTSQAAKPAVPDPPDVEAARKRVTATVRGASTLVGRFQLLAGSRIPGGVTLHGKPRGVHAGADRSYWDVAGGFNLDATLPGQPGATHAVVVLNGWTDAVHATAFVVGDRLLPSSALNPDVLAGGIVTASSVFTLLPGLFKFTFGMNQNGQFGTVKILGVTSFTVYYFAVR